MQHRFGIRGAAQLDHPRRVVAPLDPQPALAQQRMEARIAPAPRQQRPPRRRPLEEPERPPMLRDAVRAIEARVEPAVGEEVVGGADRAQS